MVLDSSALLAILLNEPERRAFNEKISADSTLLLSSASFVEKTSVIEARLGEAGARDLDLFMHKVSLTLDPVDANQAEIAHRAFRAFGKGRHPAALDFGDCFAYAIAKATGEPLLCKCGAFARMDVVIC